MLPTSKTLKFLPPYRISCGHQFTIGATDVGDLFAWGDNRNGKLGLNLGPDPIWAPTKLDSDLFPGPINEISCGSEFSLCIALPSNDFSNEAGTLMAWGVNTYGQLGISSDLSEIRIPTSVSIIERVYRISCGLDFSACISEKGRLYTWGRGNYGNLGHGTTDSLNKPQIVQSLSDQLIIHISCGSKHMAAISSSFKVYSWGNGVNGRLGHGDTSGTSSPKLIESLSTENVILISCGDNYTAAITSLGVVYSWGCGSYGRLGHGIESDLYVPGIISTLQGKRMYMVACGFRHTLALSLHGEVFAWGAGNYGVTGLFDIKDIRSMLVPLKIQFLEGKKVTQIAVGTWHSVAITSAGEVWTWGYHGHGRLGLGSETKFDQPFPRQIPSHFIYGITGGLRIMDRIAAVTGSKQLTTVKVKDSWKIVSLSCSGQNSMGLTKGGTLWVWGESKNGVLGNGESEEDQLVPTICSGLNNYIIKFISCGLQHCLAISSQGETLSWGNGKHGQLGTGFIGISFTPKILTMLSGKSPISAACGEDFSIILTEVGEVYTFGNGESGKLGHGNEVKQVYPKLVHELINITNISAGMSHAACISLDGSVYAWGSGFFGKLGTGSMDTLSSPKKIHQKSLRKYKSISCGAYHTLYIDTEDVLYGSGKKTLLSSRYDELEPKALQKFYEKKVGIVCAGEEHSLAVTLDGESFIWGANKYGKIGNGTENEPAETPVKLNLPTSLVEVCCKVNHNVVLTKAGEIYTWGCGSGGRLGLGHTNNIKVPKLLETRWATISDKNDAKNPEEEANALDMILSQIETGVRITNFKEIMMVLQNEPQDCYIEEIRKSEEELQVRFKEILLELGACKEAEKICMALVNEFENKVLQRTFELQLPQRDYFKVLIPSYIASKIPQLEKLIWILQQQPCYISRLVSTMQQRGGQEISQLVKSIRIMFSNLSKSDKSREALLYIALCKEVISKEIDNAIKLEDLFTSASCPSAQFLVTFFSREYGSELYYKVLSRPLVETIGLIEAVGNSKFNIDPSEFVKKTNKKSMGVNKILIENNAFEDAVTYTIRAVGFFVESLKSFPGVFPNGIKILLKHAYSKIISKVWLKETDKDTITQNINTAILRLVIIQLMIPVIVTPESEGLVTRQLSNEERETLGTLCDILKKIIQRSLFIGDHYSALNNFIKISNDSLIQSLESCLDIEYSSNVDLIISIFLSHFNKDQNFIHYPVNELVFTLVMFIKYRKNIEIFPTRDAAYELLEQMGDIGSVVTNSVENFKINLKMTTDFLYNQDEVGVCSVCSVLMPKALSINSDKNSSVLNLLKLDETGFVEEIEVSCRKIPKFGAATLEELSTNLRKITEVLINGINPNYKLLFDLRLADGKVNDLISRNYEMDSLLFEVSKRLSERHTQRFYLKKLSEGAHIIQTERKSYLEFLIVKQNDLKLSIENITHFHTNLNPTDKEIKQMAYYKLEQKHLQLVRSRKLNNLPADIEHEIVGDIPISILETHGVIESLAYGFSHDIKQNLKLHYSHTKQSGWRFEIIYKQAGVKNLIGLFQLDNQEFLDIKRTANSESKLEVKNVGVFRLGPFVLFLHSKIRQQIV